MEKYILDIHSSECKRIYKNDFSDCWCIRQPEQLLFFFKSDFYLIEYFKCNEGFSHLDFKQKLIESICNKTKTKQLRYSERLNINKDLKDFRIRGIQLKKWVIDYNYIYYDMCGKEFAITTAIPYYKKISNINLIDENYEKAKKELEKLNNNSLLKELQELYSWNTDYFFDEKQVVLTIDKLITKINNYDK